LSAIRDDLNDRAGEPILNTNDVGRLALRAATRYHDTDPSTGDESRPEIRTLTAAIHEAIEEGDER